MREYLETKRITRHPTEVAIFSLIGGLLYLFTLALEVLQISGVFDFWFLSGNPVTAFLLLVLSAVFLYGYQPLKQHDTEGIAFPIVGLILSAILFSLQLATVLTNALGWILSLEDWLSWNLVSDIEPTLWLFPIILAIYVSTMIYAENNKEFSSHDT